MADLENDLDKSVSIVIDEADAPIVEKTEQAVAPAPAEKVPSHEDAIAELKQRLEDEKANNERLASQKAESERRAAEESKRADTAQAEVRSSEHQIIANALEVVERDLKMAKSSYAAAMAAGDYEAAAEAQMALSEGAAKRLQLSNAKAAVEARLEARTEGRVQEPRQPAQDPVEAWASQLSPRSGKWVREHRDAVTDPTKQRKLTAAHNAAVDLEGLEADSDAYFAYIEQRLGYRPAEEEAPPHPAPRQQSRIIASAPSSTASVSGHGQRGSNSVTLSPAQREIARALGMTEKEYAINKMALQKEGKLPA
jgi:hypothetical protein